MCVCKYHNCVTEVGERDGSLSSMLVIAVTLWGSIFIGLALHSAQTYCMSKNLLALTADHYV